MIPTRVSTVPTTRYYTETCTKRANMNKTGDFVLLKRKTRDSL